MAYSKDAGNIKRKVTTTSQTPRLVWAVCWTEGHNMFAVTVCILGLLHMSSSCSWPGVCTDLTSVQQEIVDVHNAFRSAVDPPASNMLKMNWSDAVAQSAQDWIDQCNMTHGPPSSRLIDGYEMGENLFKASGLYSWTEVVNAWHSEVNNYQYPSGSVNGQPTGHYTQVVWYSSYEVGCAMTQCGSSYFYGCHYYRAGNFRGVSPYSLGSPCESCPDHCQDHLCTNPCPYINKYMNCDAMKDQFSCANPSVSEGCPASCLCEDKIIPIARK